MDNELTLKYIGRVYTDFGEKFGVPRQPGRVPGLTGKIIFEPEFRVPAAFSGLETFSHIWVLFDFSLAHREKWSPTVRPPRLGGNRHAGVFATRSPFRPNPVGLSALKLDRIETDPELGAVLYVSGVDMVSGTPVLDIKPYLPYADSIDGATGGFTDELKDRLLEVRFPEGEAAKLPYEVRARLEAVLSLDPRPSYHEDPGRIYGMNFAGYEVRFNVEGERVTVLGIIVPDGTGSGGNNEVDGE